jgi:hypothetical protein
MEKILDPGWPREPQGLAASIGTAFDIMIKIEVASKMGWGDLLRNKVKCPENESIYNYLVRKNILEENIKKALVEGHSIYKYYLSVLPIELHRIGISWHDLELTRQFYIPGLEGSIQDILAYCKGDGAFSYLIDNIDTVELPMDWKVTGSASKASPTQRYEMIYDDLGIPKGPHKLWCNDIHMDIINIDWATQLCFSGWQLGYPTQLKDLKVFTGVIHNLVCDSTTGKIRLAVYRGLLTTDFQASVIKRIQNMWVDITTGKFYQRHKDIDLTSMMALQETWW